jgi:hypothetical protein
MKKQYLKKLLPALIILFVIAACVTLVEADNTSSDPSAQVSASILGISDLLGMIPGSDSSDVADPSATGNAPSASVTDPSVANPIATDTSDLSDVLPADIASSVPTDIKPNWCYFSRWKCSCTNRQWNTSRYKY